jgi:hypothetical protein
VVYILVSSPPVIEKIEVLRVARSNPAKGIGWKLLEKVLKPLETKKDVLASCCTTNSQFESFGVAVQFKFWHGSAVVQDFCHLSGHRSVM